MGRKKGSPKPGKPRSNTRKRNRLKSMQEATEKRRYASNGHLEKKSAEESHEETQPIIRPGFSREAEVVNMENLPRDKAAQREYLRKRREGSSLAHT